MIAFIKGNNIKNIKYKLGLLYLLNVTDIIFTLLLLNTGLFNEGNKIMINIVANPFSSIIIKIVLILIIFIILYERMKSANSKQLKVSNYIIIGAIAFYGLINLTHIIWTILAFIIL